MVLIARELESVMLGDSPKCRSCLKISKNIMLNDSPKCRSDPQMTQMDTDVKPGAVMFNMCPGCPKWGNKVLKF